MPTLVKSRPYRNLSPRANHVLNVVKSRYGLRSNAAAIEKLAEEYEREFLDLELKPEYIDRLRRLERERTVKVRDLRQYFTAMRWRAEKPQDSLVEFFRRSPLRGVHLDLRRAKDKDRLVKEVQRRSPYFMLQFS